MGKSGTGAAQIRLRNPVPVMMPIPQTMLKMPLTSVISAIAITSEGLVWMLFSMRSPVLRLYTLRRKFGRGIKRACARQALEDGGIVSFGRPGR
ncbi:MAG: hypothetical protein DYG87_00900 [Anaerolineae bacterium CFX3]|nr:hypothetical protein [Anaerolineae bacterium]MCE7904337.1 hypothetical protein [Anaerolineae bacterium CFX3]MCQ3946151.1 hypothetical protein [Anaerolineae bacterium]RIK27570.1 MAG: hypothetical protein DCC54_02870 [Anaerolineae bacterium]